MQTFSKASFATVLGLLGFGASAITAHAQVSPPQGYISINRTISGDSPSYYDGKQTGFYNFDFPFQLSKVGADMAGTFWANNFAFKGSDGPGALPANHVGGVQGGYLGLQVLDATQNVAIFSLWWATASKPGPNATCYDDIEMWYNDDRPFDPPITDAKVTDQNRKTAGGPFHSCRLDVKLEANKQYKLRLWEVSDGNLADDPEWWGAWLINETDDTEEMIGQIQVPGNWDWLNNGAGGFVEHFGPMPKGCGSIPANTSIFKVVQADAGTFQSTISTNSYGACKADIDARSSLSCSGDACTVKIN